MKKQVTEAEWADRFDQDVQTLLQSGTLPNQNSQDLPQGYREALITAQTLRSAQVAHLSQVRESLRQKYNRSGDQQDMWSNNHWKGSVPMFFGFSKLSPTRRFAVLFALIALFLSLSLTIQPVRALAGQMIGQIGLFHFTQEAAIPDEWIGQENFQSAANATSTPLPIQSLNGLSREDAEQKAGFAPLSPGYLPACFSFNSYNLLDRQGAPSLLTAYECPGESIYDRVFLELDQTRMQGGKKIDYPIGDAQPVEIALRGQTGLWINQAPIGVQTDRDGKTQQMAVNLLVWEEDGFFFQMRSNQLSQEEMVKIAESLK